MRDADRVRERITIALEPRQVTWLVVAGLVLLGGLFTGGYLLGKQHGGGATPMGPELSGLAAIDAVSSPKSSAPESAEARPAAGALGEVEFMFPSALGSRPGRKVKRRGTVRLAEDRVGATGVALPPAPKPAKVEKKPKKVRLRPARIAEARPKPRRTPAPARAALPPPAMQRLTVMPARPAVAAPAVPASALPAPALARQDEDAPAARPAPPKPTPAANQRRYTVQLRSAHAQEQADDFADQLRRKGYSPRVVLAQVPGKGKLYRVRVGEFGSRAEARRFQRTFRTKTGHADAGFITEL